MRKRVILLAAALGAASAIGFAPQAQASCTQLWVDGPCIENVICRSLERVLGPQNCIQ